MLTRTYILAFTLGILCQLIPVEAVKSQSKPLPPILDVISVNPATGATSLKWTKPKYNPLNPNPTGYIVYRRYTDALGNNDLYSIGNVDENTFTYTDSEYDAGLGSVSYAVASDGPTEPSPMSAEHYTMFLTAKFDSCHDALHLMWTHYEGWGNNIGYSKIYVGKILNFESFTLVDSIVGTKTEILIDSAKLKPFEFNQQYYVFISAKKLSSELVTSSNLSRVYTKISRPPDFMYVDSIIAQDRQTELYFSIDPQTEYRSFCVVRWEQQDSVKSIFSAKNLFSFSEPTTTFFADTSDSWAARSRKFFFKIVAFDGCERLKWQSNLSNSMVMRVFTGGMKANLSWDPFYSAKGNPVRYRIYKTAFNPDPIAPEVIFDKVNPTDTKYEDDLSVYSGIGYQPQFCYYIEAYENLNIPSKEDRLSRSRTICTEVTPQIVMPNAIDPTSQIVQNGIPRNVFAPTLSFELSYKLIVYSRWGGVLFEGNNTGWNGHLPDGKLAEEGTYLYRLEVYPESGKTISKTGTVSVLFGPS